MQSRADWGAKPAESVTPWDVSKLEGICQHWFGSPKAASSHAGCDDLLRSVQAGHQAGEFSDIAYNFGVCPHGETYELRGWNRKTGANGREPENSTLLAIVYMAGVGDPFTAAAKAATKRLYAQAFAKGVGRRIVKHGSITGSACPGPAIGAWLDSGAWRPDERKWIVILESNDNSDPGTAPQRIEKSAVVGTDGINERLITFATRVSKQFEDLAKRGRNPRIRVVRAP